ncbi:transposase [Streptomyces sp. NPDC002547]
MGRPPGRLPPRADQPDLEPLRISGHDYIQVRFGEAACRACTDRAQCINSEVRPRSLALLPTRALHEIQQANRLDQTDPAVAGPLRDPGRNRATLSQNIRTCGLRRTRYRGLRKTHVQHIPDRSGLQRHPDHRLDGHTDPKTADTQPLPRPLHHQLTPTRSQ